MKVFSLVFVFFTLIFLVSCGKQDISTPEDTSSTGADDVQVLEENNIEVVENEFVGEDDLADVPAEALELECTEIVEKGPDGVKTLGGTWLVKDYLNARNFTQEEGDDFQIIFKNDNCEDLPGEGNNIVCALIREGDIAKVEDAEFDDFTKAVIKSLIRGESQCSELGADDRGDCNYTFIKMNVAKDSADEGSFNLERYNSEINSYFQTTCKEQSETEE